MRYERQDAIRNLSLLRRWGVGKSTVLSEQHSCRRVPEPRDTTVNERRIVMTMDHIRALTTSSSSDAISEHRVKACLPTERLDVHVIAPKFFAPLAGVIEAAYRHLDFRRRSFNEFENQTLCAARGQTQDNLQYSRDPNSRHDRASRRLKS